MFLRSITSHSALIGPDVYNATLAASLLTILANASRFKLLKPAAALVPPPVHA